MDTIVCLYVSKSSSYNELPGMTQSYALDQVTVTATLLIQQAE